MKKHSAVCLLIMMGFVSTAWAQNGDDPQKKKHEMKANVSMNASQFNSQNIGAGLQIGFEGKTLPFHYVDQDAQAHFSGSVGFEADGLTTAPTARVEAFMLPTHSGLVGRMGARTDMSFTQYNVFPEVGFGTKSENGYFAFMAVPMEVVQGYSMNGFHLAFKGQVLEFNDQGLAVFMDTKLTGQSDRASFTSIAGGIELKRKSTGQVVSVSVGSEKFQAQGKESLSRVNGKLKVAIPLR